MVLGWFLLLFGKAADDEEGFLMAEQGLGLKTLQYLTGHSDVRVTMEVYTHVNMETVKRELLRAEGRRRL